MHVSRIPGYVRYALTLAGSVAAGLGRSLERRALTLGEGILGAGRGALRHRPIFIIGPPRSGSTLLYQILVERYDVGYIANFHCNYFHGPAVGELVARHRRDSYRSDFSSHYGTVEGVWAPAECGHFWYRFFSRTPMYAPLSAVQPVKMARMRRAIRALTRIFDRPILFKNMNCALRLEPICYYLPEALFIVTHRDTAENSRSILDARLKLYQSVERWYSLEPPDIDTLRTLPVAEQAVRQVTGIHQRIEQDAQAQGAGKFFHLDYERFCRDVYGVLAELEAFLAGHGVSLVRRGEVPERFEQTRAGRGLSAELAAEVDRLVAQ